MPRRNSNVRERNLPRAAQRQPRGAKGTQRALSDARHDRASSRQPSALDRSDREYLLYAGFAANLD